MRSLVAIVAGAAVAAVLYQVAAIIALLAVVGVPLGAAGGPHSAGLYLLNLGLAGLAAVVGGAVGARLAGVTRGVVVPVLALVLAGVALWGFSKPTSQWPGWYAPMLALIAAAGALLGGRL